MGGNIPEICENIRPYAALEAVEALRNEIRSDNAIIRMRSAIALGELGPPAKIAVPELIQMAKENNVWCNLYAAQALGNIGPEAGDAIPAIIDLLKSANDQVQYQAGYAISRIGIQGYLKEALPVIKAMFDGKYQYFRRYAAASLASVGPEAKEVIPVLVKALRDEDFMVVWLAANALGNMKQEGRVALPALREALRKQYDPAGVIYITDDIQRIENAK